MEAKIIVPKSNGETCVHDITHVNKVIQNLEMINNVTPATFGQFSVDIILAFNEVNRLLSTIDLELRLASNNLDVQKSIVLLEEAEDVIKSKNLKSSADIREAVVLTNQKVQELQKTKDTLKSLYEYVSGLRDILDKTYFSVKQIAEYSATRPLG